MGSLANSEDPDEMLQSAADCSISSGSALFVRVELKQSSKNEKPIKFLLYQHKWKNHTVPKLLKIWSVKHTRYVKIKLRVFPK